MPFGRSAPKSGRSELLKDDESSTLRSEDEDFTTPPQQPSPLIQPAHKKQIMLKDMNKPSTSSLHSNNSNPTRTLVNSITAPGSLHNQLVNQNGHKISITSANHFSAAGHSLGHFSFSPGRDRHPVIGENTQLESLNR